MEVLKSSRVPSARQHISTPPPSPLLTPLRPSPLFLCPQPLFSSLAKVPLLPSLFCSHPEPSVLSPFSSPPIWPVGTGIRSSFSLVGKPGFPSLPGACAWLHFWLFAPHPESHQVGCSFGHTSGGDWDTPPSRASPWGSEEQRGGTAVLCTMSPHVGSLFITKIWFPAQSDSVYPVCYCELDTTQHSHSPSIGTGHSKSWPPPGAQQ